MNAPAAIPAARGRPPMARFALRDLRGGLAGLRIFFLCIALGVAAIVGVESLARALNDGLGREGRVILGGDASFSLIHRRLSPDEQGFLERYGSLSTIATMRGMARTASGDAALVEIKAVEPSWPQIGAAVFEPPMSPAEALAEKDGVFGAAVEETLLARLNLKIGDVFRIGEAKFVLDTVVISEPDRLATGIGLGPRVLISQAALDATGLVQPGSLVRWTTRVIMGGPGGAPDEAAVQALLATPNGLSAGRLGDPLAPQCLARLQPRPRPVRRIPDAGRPPVAGRRRGRRRQRGAGLRRAQARDARDPEGDRRDRNERRRARADRIPDRRDDRRARGRGARRGDPVRRRLALRLAAADPARAVDRAGRDRARARLRPLDGARLLDRAARAGRTTCRSRR